MALKFEIPQLELTPEHIRSVRLYLSEMYDMPTPITQAEMASLLGCGNTNSYAKWERLDNSPPAMVLMFLQRQISCVHQRLRMYQSETHSMGLFFAFHADVTRTVVDEAAVRRNRILYEGAWAFGELDSFNHWRLPDTPLTIRNSFGGRSKLRTYPIFLLDQMIRQDDEAMMSADDIHHMREELAVLVDRSRNDGTATVQFEHFDVTLEGGTLTIFVRNPDHQALLQNRFSDAYSQFCLDMTPELSDELIERKGRHVLMRCVSDPESGRVIFRHFIGADNRVKFLQLSQLGAALDRKSALPAKEPLFSAGFELWRAMQVGERKSSGTTFKVALEGRDLTIRIDDTWKRALKSLANSL